MTTALSEGPWLRTPEACVALGISRDTLQVRKREGLFQAGRDYIRTGRHAKSPCLWNIQSARAQMAMWAAPALVEVD